MKNFFILRGLSLLIAFNFNGAKNIYALGSLDTTLSGTTAALFIDPVYNLDPGASAKGNITFNQGIALKGTGLGNTSTSTSDFGCSGPISAIYLNGQTLRLTSDIYMSGDSTYGRSYLVGPGFIVPNGHTIHLTCRLHVLNDVYWYTYGTYGFISGNGNLFYMGTSDPVAPGRFLLNCPSVTRFSNLTFENISSDNFVFIGYNWNAMYDVTFRVNPNSTFVLGGVEFNGNCVFDAPYSVVKLDVVDIVRAASTLTLTPRTRLMHRGDLYNDDTTSKIVIDNASIEMAHFYEDVVPNNWTPRSGQLIINGRSTIKARLPGSHLELGNGSTYDTEIIINPASTLVIDANTTVDYNDIT